MTPSAAPTEKCPTCGAARRAYWHKLTPGLVGCLVKAIRAVKRLGKNEFHLQRDLELSRTEYANFQKLRFHALVAKTKRRGYWLITDRGGAFLRGDILVPREVLTFRNKVQEHGTVLVSIHDIGKKGEFQEEFRFEIRDGMYRDAKVEAKQTALAI